ncbi:hypothetical protein [Thermus phage P23-45]|uniref:Tail assembly chaperone n=2 Tax=Oshimavirus TaxID=1623293 RepID=A7XXC9_BP234|nr:hypothetical protein P23p95 [Thermus phage P23-45]YP_001468064.1 hypothetical protein P74p94 [Thermus phage P74-26]API81898.1 hypothetical protein G20c_90 [Thermus phage G20c]ABU96928.1 hypothetical protein P23p95 [Thermus phage P23-45]ABU97044.1 hypothetical protein P74p94 [Thermus phage P74-26]UYB98496.1 hypothetical protein [Thermus phage P23-45]
MTRLSDLFAPEWTLQVGEEVWRMRPLSLATLAEAEGQGILLENLQAGDLQSWTRFLEFLSGVEAAKLVAALEKYPLVLEAFQRKVMWAFGADDASEVKVNRRRVKNPLKDTKEEVKPEPTDFGFLVTLSRVTGIALSDLSRMTLRGLMAVQASLKDLPPAPKLF